MDKTTITFRIDSDMKNALDAIAEGMDRDRSYVLNEAVSAYLDTHRWQIDHIKEGLRQADAGEFATEAEVAAAFRRWRK
jgi:predicted transcriptional regulator